MLRASYRMAVLLTSLSLTTLGANYVSAAEPDCKLKDKKSGACVITIEVPGTPAAQPVDNPTRGGGGKPACLGYGDEPKPCTDPFFGSWSNAMQCYLKLADPQPAESDEIWEGNYPRGAVYLCGDPDNSANALVWLPQGPEAEQMSPEQAARIVVARMDLRAADIGIVPEDLPGRIGAVGAPVYMWTSRSPATFGPQVLTGSAGGVTITATAKVDKIVWTMGDGTSVTCRTPGTVYQDRFGFDMSPDCGHRYTKTSAGKPNNAYPVSATSYWVVDWTGPGGSSGRVTLDLVSRTNIVVGELQALVTS